MLNMDTYGCEDSLRDFLRILREESHSAILKMTSTFSDFMTALIDKGCRFSQLLNQTLGFKLCSM